MKSTGNLLRHSFAIAFLLLAWFKLNHWYAYLHPVDYWLFALSFVAAFITGPSGQIRYLFKGAGLARTVVAAGLMALALPWGEWLRLALPNAREDWSRQLLFEFSLLYGSFLVLRAAPVLRFFLKNQVVGALNRSSSRKFWYFILPVFFFCFTSWIVLVTFDKTLSIQDAAAHMFQAKVFRAGHLFAPAPPAPAAFTSVGDMLILHDGKWYSMYLPGFSMLLAAAMWVRLEWLVCPALGAGTLAIWIVYCRKWHEKWISPVLGILFIFSPMLVLMYSSNMVHCAELFFASCTIFLCRQLSERPAKRDMLLLFLSLFLGIITRGFSFVPFVAPALAYAAWKRINDRLAVFALSVIVAALAGVVLIAAYQWKTTGDPARAAYELEYQPPMFYGFHGITLGQVHTPLRGLENTSNNWLGMNTWLTGWPAGALFFLVLFILKEKRIQAWDVVLFLCCVALAVFYFFFVFQDLVRGPRFWFPMAPILLLFVARGVFVEDNRIRSYVVTLAFLSFVAAVVFYVPRYIKKYSPAPTQPGQLHAELQKLGNQKTLIFLDKHVPQQLVNWNDPFFRENLVFCSDRGPLNSEVVRAFPGYVSKYFRESQSIKKSVLTSGYRLVDTPDPDPPGHISLFNFALMIQSANAYRDDDLFDLSYVQFLAADTAADQLRYLTDMNDSDTSESKVRQALRTGLIHSARMVLLPKRACEQRRDQWQQGLNVAEFRSELLEASASFRAAGETGKALLEQIQKISQRIDQDDDGALSDQEILGFLTRKVQILQLG